MSEGEEKKNFKNMMELVELISNVDDVITELQDKDVLSLEEVQELVSDLKRHNLCKIFCKKDRFAKLM